MNEVSLILKNKLALTVEEIRILDRLSCIGKIWTLVQRPTQLNPFRATFTRTEYIFDPEAITIFYIVSRNVLATWDTNITRSFGPNDELQILDSIFIRPYYTAPVDLSE